MDAAPDPRTEARRLAAVIVDAASNLRRAVDEAQELVMESRRGREERQQDDRLGGLLASHWIGGMGRQTHS